MPISPSDLDLTDLAAVKRLLQKPADDNGAQDDLLQEMITEASVMLPNELGRSFIAETGVTKTFAYQGRGYLDLAPQDLRTVTGVEKDSDGTSPLTLTAGAWVLRDATGAGTYRTLTLTDYTRERLVDQTVSVTGDWGFEEIPADVSRGVKITVKTWLREGASFTPDGDVIRFERVGRIPQDVLDGLAHYRMPTV